MAQSNPFDQFDGQSQPVPLSTIKPIISTQEAEKAPAPPSGYERTAGGGLSYIPGGPDDPEVIARNAAIKKDVEVSGAKPTESQQKASTLVTRIAGGFQDIENVIAKSPEAQSPGLVETVRGGLSPTGLMAPVSRSIAGAERRVVYDAQRDVLDALLTLGTGAAYSPEQLEAQMGGYFPQYGDTQEEIDYKNNRMRRLIESARENAGPLAPKIDEVLQKFNMPSGQSAEQEQKSIGGGTFMTEQDKTYQAELQSAFDGGASAEQLNAIAARFGRPALTGIQQAIEARDKGTKGIRANVEPTGVAEAPSALREAATGYAAGAANALTAGQLDELAPIIGLDPQQVEAAKAYLQQNAPVSSMLGEVTGGALASIPMVRGAGAALAGSRLAAAAPLVGETAYGAAYGAGEAPKGQRGMGALVGGAGAMAGGALANRFMPGSSGTWSGVEKRSAAPSFGGPQASPQQVIEAGQQFNVPVMTSDVTPPDTFMGRVTQQIGDVVPLGTAGRRRGQQEARIQAVETLLADAGVTVDQNIASEVVKGLNAKRSADISKYKGLKDDVIDRYNTMGDVQAPKALDAIDGLLASLKGENMSRQLGGLISNLDDVKRSLEGPGGLRKIEDNRATIFGLKGDDALSSVKGKAEKAFTKVYNSLNEDMGDFIKANGDMKDFNKWKVANTKLATMVGELEQQGLKRVLDKGDFDPDVVRRMLNSKNPQEVRLLFTNLGKQGRTNARLLLLQDAAQKAFNNETKEINPQAFTKAVLGAENGFRQFFGGEEAKKVKGLAALMTATRRAQEAQFAPRTGERLVPFATAGSFAGLASLLGMDFLGGVGLAAGFGAARSLYESPPVRNLLVKIGETSGSQQAQLIQRLQNNIASAAGAVGAEKVAGPEDQQFGAPAQ